MKKLIFAIGLMFATSIIHAQNPRTVSSLSDKIKETSGLLVITNNEFWTHNDSGDGPYIYKIDSNGIILDSIFLSGINAIDFEDIAKDNQGNFYIGDIGNNNHNRTNLVVYKIPNPDSIIGNSVIPEVIHYSYSDQTQFPDPDKNVDCEALFHYQGNLYLISKNWGNSGFSKLYQLPDTAGTYSAVLIDSFASGMVTGADILPNGKLAVLEMTKIHLFDNYSGTDFFGGTHGIKSFNLSQKEGLAFLDSTTIYLTQEYHRFFGGAELLVLDLTTFIGNVEITKQMEISAYPNPAGEYLELGFDVPNLIESKLKIRIFDASGKTILNYSTNVSETIIIPLLGLKPGNYYIQIRSKKQRITKPFIKK